MKMKILNSIVILAMVLSLPVIATRSAYSPEGVSVKPRIAIGAQTPSGEHLVMPRDEIILADLTELGRISSLSSEDDVKAAVAQYKTAFAKKSDTWVNPQMEEQAIAREDQLSSAPMAAQAVQPVSVSIFTLAVDFDTTGETVYFDDVFSELGCEEGALPVSDTLSGPAVGTIPYPAPADNNTLWYDPSLYTTDPASFYNDMIFGYDGVGRVRADEAARGETGADILTDPRDGLPGIDLTGYTVQDYYDHVAGAGNVILNGNTFGWVTVDHPEAYYGADSCGGSHYGGAWTFDGSTYTSIPVSTLVKDAVEKFNAENPGFDWTQFDQNGDHIMDTFWIIYAGVGQEAGGGALGEFALWSHSSDVRYYFPGGIYAGDGIYVGPYTMQPETADVGVMTEEFGHNVFGLPDLYVTDTQGSIAFWSTMESGSWGGYLGGSMPVGMPLWFRMIAWCDTGPCNWQNPMLIRNYDDPSADVTLRQLESQTLDLAREDWGPTTPAGATYKGVRINLPDAVQEVYNEAGTGNAAWSGLGNYMDISLATTVAVPASGDMILTFDSYWDIEECGLTACDYGYFEVDAGSGWVALDDVGSYFSTEAPLGPGLDGTDGDTLAFNLSAYAGTTVGIRLRYVTDPAANGAGWWADNVMMGLTPVDAFESATAPNTFPGWTNNGWQVVPFTKYHTQYYLVEWRNATKYDQSVRTAYITTDSGDNLWKVERVPYNIPGALIYFRNTRYSNTYSQGGNAFDPPSYGPKYQLLLVDMNYMPMTLWPKYASILNARVGSYDATLSLDDTDPFTISQVYRAAGNRVGPFNFPAKDAVTNFNDAQQYYSGWFIYSGGWYLGYDDSTVIPARDLYSASMWDLPGNPWGSWMLGEPDGTSWVGSGKPGDDSVQYGVNIDLLDQGADGEFGVLRFRNHSVDFISGMTSAVDGSYFDITYTTDVINQSPQIVYNVAANFELDPLCEYTGSSAVSSKGDSQYISYSVGHVIWQIPEDGLDIGETVTLEVTCQTPRRRLPDGSYDFGEADAWITGNDGQIERGPWEFYFYDETSLSGFAFGFPVIVR
jgi:immune inhibitor A